MEKDMSGDEVYAERMSVMARRYKRHYERFQDDVYIAFCCRRRRAHAEGRERFVERFVQNVHTSLPLWLRPPLSASVIMPRRG